MIMDTEETTLELFLRDRIKDKGISLKKLSDMTGISINHIENMLRGDFENVPPTPYFRGYLIRLGEALNFDGEAWWMKIKREEGVGRSGSADALPKNRFVRESPAKIIAIWAAGFIALITIIFSLPHILGKPSITIISPRGNPYTTASTSVIIQGTVKNADSLYVEGDEATIASNGSWQKNVLLQSGMNTFNISAKKLLGGTTNIMEQVFYDAPSSPSTSASSTVSPTSTSTSTTSSAGQPR
jgi:transcriptional regulator with XRE-family HTH domain